MKCVVCDRGRVRAETPVMVPLCFKHVNTFYTSIRAKGVQIQLI